MWSGRGGGFSQNRSRGLSDRGGGPAVVLLLEDVLLTPSAPRGKNPRLALPYPSPAFALRLVVTCRRGLVGKSAFGGFPHDAEEARLRAVDAGAFGPRERAQTVLCFPLASLSLSSLPVRRPSPPARGSNGSLASTLPRENAVAKRRRGVRGQGPCGVWGRAPRFAVVLKGVAL